MTTPLRQRMLEELQRRNYSSRTIRLYLRHVAEFAKHFHRSPDQLGADRCGAAHGSRCSRTPRGSPAGRDKGTPAQKSTPMKCLQQRFSEDNGRYGDGHNKQRSQSDGRNLC